MLKNEERKRKLTFKRANLATWGEKDVDSNDDEDKEYESILVKSVWHLLPPKQKEGSICTEIQKQDKACYISIMCFDFHLIMP